MKNQLRLGRRYPPPNQLRLFLKVALQEQKKALQFLDVSTRMCVLFDLCLRSWGLMARGGTFNINFLIYHHKKYFCINFLISPII